MSNVPKTPPTSRSRFTLRLADVALAEFDELAIKHSKPGAVLNRTDVAKVHLTIGKRHLDEVERLLKQIVEARS